MWLLDHGGSLEIQFETQRGSTDFNIPLRNGRIKEKLRRDPYAHRQA